MSNIYQQALGVVEHNTGGPRDPIPAGLPQASLRGQLARLGYEPQDAWDAINLLAENGDLYLWEDDDGRVRVARTTEDGLKAIIGEQNASDDPDQELIREVASLLG